MRGLSGKGCAATTTAARTMRPTMAKPPSRPTATPAAAAKPAAKADPGPRTIAENRRARFDYFIEERYEAGLVLEGWEVKALRAGKAQITEAHVYLRNGEVFMVGAHISPLKTTSTHVIADPTRSRKLLLNHREIAHLIGAVERQGYTIVPLELYWQRGKAKVRIGLAKGKKAHDKRATEKDRDWQRDKSRLMRRG
jgi:SsrA-binding protein